MTTMSVVPASVAAPGSRSSMRHGRYNESCHLAASRQGDVLSVGGEAGPTEPERASATGPGVP